jgi:hypothetical protein
VVKEQKVNTRQGWKTTAVPLNFSHHSNEGYYERLCSADNLLWYPKDKRRRIILYYISFLLINTPKESYVQKETPAKTTSQINSPFQYSKKKNIYFTLKSVSSFKIVNVVISYDPEILLSGVYSKIAKIEDQTDAWFLSCFKFFFFFCGIGD